MEDENDEDICNNDQEDAPLLKGQLNALVTVSVAEYRTTAWNSVYKYRKCKHCNVVTPPRTYHCKATDKCVMRFDHYCMWISTSIGLLNYKFYWQMILYQMLAMMTLSLHVYRLDGLTLLSGLSGIYFIEQLILFSVFTYRALKNITTQEKDKLVGQYNIYCDKTVCENWR